MKNYVAPRLLAFFAYFLFLTPLHAQEEEVKWLNPVPGGNDITNISFLSSGKGLMINMHGEILKTNDKAKTWEVVYQSNQSLYSMAIVNNTVYAVGWYGTFLKSTDGGETWNKLDIKTSTPLSEVFFLTETLGYIIDWDGKLFKTGNGGLDWNEIIVGSTVNSVHFLNEQTGFASSSGAIHKTIDGGKTWSRYVYAKNGGVGEFTFLNESIGFAVGSIGVSGPIKQSRLLKTIDGGESWYEVNPGTNGGLNAVYFIDDKIGYCVGGDNTIIKTIDEGETWQEINNVEYGLNSWLNDIKFVSSTEGYAAGRFGVILKTENGGNSWASLTSFTTSYFTSSESVNDSIWYIAGEKGNIFKTINKGESWTKLSTGVVDWLNDLQFIHPDTGVSIGGVYSPGSATIIKTVNGGKDWIKITNPIGNRLLGLKMLDSKIWYVTGENGNIARTQDGGLTWVSLKSNTIQALSDVFFTSKDIGYVVGHKGTVLKTTDGTTWSKLSLGSEKDFYSVFFIDSNIGFVAGGYGELYKTTNGGETWVKQSFSFYLDIHVVKFINKDIGYFGGDGGNIFKTTDGGSKWTKIFNGGFRVESLSVVGKNKMFAAGGGGAILTLISGPFKRPFIEGVAAPCQSKTPYRVKEPEAGISYKWSLLDGGILAENGNSCYVTWNKSGTFKLMVTATDNSGNSLYSELMVNVSPSVLKPEINQRNSISNSNDINSLMPLCPSETVFWVNNPQEGTTYNWALERGGTITPKGDSCVVNWDKSGTWDLKVVAQNFCGSTLSSLKVEVKPELSKPIVTQLDSLLNSSEGDNYQWFMDEKEIIGANERTIKIKNIGIYKVRVDGECTQLFSEPFNAILLSSESEKVNKVSIYPNPAEDVLMIETFSIKAFVKIDLINATGHLQEMNYTKISSNKYLLDVKNIAAGVYILRLHSKSAVISNKVVLK